MKTNVCRKIRITKERIFLQLFPVPTSVFNRQANLILPQTYIKLAPPLTFVIYLEFLHSNQIIEMLCILSEVENGKGK